MNHPPRPRKTFNLPGALRERARELAAEADDAGADFDDIVAVLAVEFDQTLSTVRALVRPRDLGDLLPVEPRPQQTWQVGDQWTVRAQVVRDRRGVRIVSVVCPHCRRQHAHAIADFEGYRPTRTSECGLGTYTVHLYRR